MEGKGTNRQAGAGCHPAPAGKAREAHTQPPAPTRATTPAPREELTETNPAITITPKGPGPKRKRKTGKKRKKTRNNKALLQVCSKAERGQGRPKPPGKNREFLQPCCAPAAGPTYARFISLCRFFSFGHGCPTPYCRDSKRGGTPAQPQGCEQDANGGRQQELTIPGRSPGKERSHEAAGKRPALAASESPVLVAR